MKHIIRLCFASIAVTVSAQEKPVSETIIRQFDMAYLGPDREEKLDLYLPAQDSGTLRPGILIIHGGGWVKGDKRAAREINIAETLATAGYVCASINYKLGVRGSASFPGKLESAWPQNLHDCKTAVRWLKKHAAQYSINPDRIGVIGGSAGGHLTAMIGMTGVADGLEPAGPYAEYSTQVQAIVPMYPPADLVDRSHERKIWDRLSTKQRELCRVGSPVSYADANDPPVLILHGTRDTTVSIRQSERLVAAIQKAGGDCHFEVVEGGPHSFHLQPKQEDLRPLVLEFFDRHLKKSADDVRIEILDSKETEASFRGIVVVDEKTVIATGNGGTVLKSIDSGTTWQRLQISESADELDFRDIELSTDGSLVLMSAGLGEKSRIFRSDNGGESWSIVFQNDNPQAFFNGMTFWKNGHGLLVGDPIDGQLYLLKTEDHGRTWQPLAGPKTRHGEYGFAASGTGIVAGSDGRVWIATGAAASRVFLTEDEGQTWDVAETPVRAGDKGAGIFSIAFQRQHGVIVGGDYERPELSSANFAVSSDNGHHWISGAGEMPHKACVRFLDASKVLAVGRTGIMLSADGGHHWRTISTESFYTFDVDKSTKTVFLAGANGRLARMLFPATDSK